MSWDVRNVKVIVPLRPCDSRTLTEQTLGRGLRKMHPPVIEDDGSASMTNEELYVIEHPSFAAILDQIKDLIEEKKSEDIDHRPEYVAVTPHPEIEKREAADVRLVRLEGMRHGAREWRQDLDVNRLPALAPRLPWQEEIDDTVIQTLFGSYTDPKISRDGIDVINEMERQLNRRAQDTFGELVVNALKGAGRVPTTERAKRVAMCSVERMERLDALIVAAKKFIDAAGSTSGSASGAFCTDSVRTGPVANEDQ